MSTHKERHEELHKMLDELVADFISQTTKTPSRATVLELMEWSHQQTVEPTGIYADYYDENP